MPFALGLLVAQAADPTGTLTLAQANTRDVLAALGRKLSKFFVFETAPRRAAGATTSSRPDLGAVLSFWSNRSSFLIGELLLGNLSKMVVVVGNAPRDRPGFLVGHLIGNRASLLCTKAPMLR